MNLLNISKTLGEDMVMEPFEIRQRIFNNVSDKLEGMDMVEAMGGLDVLQFDDVSILYTLARDSNGDIIEPTRLRSTMSIGTVEKLYTHIVMELKIDE